MKKKYLLKTPLCSPRTLRARLTGMEKEKEELPKSIVFIEKNEEGPI
jgi:hypothetical protein